MWPFKSTNYPKQQLTDKQRDLLIHIDEALVRAHEGKRVAGQMLVKYTGVGYMRTLLPLMSLIDGITLEYGDSYIPRSVSLVVDSDGNWVFFYAIRAETGTDSITNLLFIDSLNRTNNAR